MARRPWDRLSWRLKINPGRSNPNGEEQSKQKQHTPLVQGRAGKGPLRHGQRRTVSGCGQTAAGRQRQQCAAGASWRQLTRQQHASVQHAVCPWWRQQQRRRGCALGGREWGLAAERQGRRPPAVAGSPATAPAEGAGGWAADRWLSAGRGGAWWHATPGQKSSHPITRPASATKQRGGCFVMAGRPQLSWQCRTTAAPHLGGRQLQVKAVGVRGPNGDACGGRHAVGHLGRRSLAHRGAAGRGEEGQQAGGIVGGRRGGCSRDGPATAISGSWGRLGGCRQCEHSRAHFFEGHGSCKGVGRVGAAAGGRGGGASGSGRQRGWAARTLARLHTSAGSFACIPGARCALRPLGRRMMGRIVSRGLLETV